MTRYDRWWHVILLFHKPPHTNSQFTILASAMYHRKCLCPSKQEKTTNYWPKTQYKMPEFSRRKISNLKKINASPATNCFALTKTLHPVVRRWRLGCPEKHEKQQYPFNINVHPPWKFWNIWLGNVYVIILIMGIKRILNSENIKALFVAQDVRKKKINSKSKLDGWKENLRLFNRVKNKSKSIWNC